jgi:hypothetical protein
LSNLFCWWSVGWSLEKHLRILSCTLYKIPFYRLYRLAGLHAWVAPFHPTCNLLPQFSVLINRSLFVGEGEKGLQVFKSYKWLVLSPTMLKTNFTFHTL